MTLFKIGLTDLSSYADPEKHAVNRADVYEEWTDGNWITHREMVRTRVAGTVVLKFKRSADYSTVLSLLSTARNANGYYSITVYCSNTDTLENIDAFLTYNGETKWDVTTPMVWQGLTITVTQR